MTPTTSVDLKIMVNLFQFSFRNLESRWQESQGDRIAWRQFMRPHQMLWPQIVMKEHLNMYLLLGRCNGVRGSRPEVDAWLQWGLGGGWLHGPYSQKVDISIDVGKQISQLITIWSEWQQQTPRWGDIYISVDALQADSGRGWAAFLYCCFLFNIFIGV